MISVETNKNEAKMKTTKKIKAYDLPTRMFHWLFAGFFVFAFVVAKVIDDDSPLYSYHMLAGIFMVFLVMLRVVWGVVGSHYAKFSSFKLSRSELIQYLSNILSSKSKRYLGHNPASSYAAIGMFVFTICLGVTGLLMSKGVGSDFFEEIHELCGNGFVLMVIFHVAGIVFHESKHSDKIILSMITGNKDPVEGAKPIASNSNIVAIFFVGLVVSFALYLNQNYDSNTQKLNLLGLQIELGEDEHEHSHDSHEYDEEEDDDDDDD